MPAPYSAGLRKRIAEFYNDSEGTLSETAVRFRVSVKSVWNSVSRFRKENTAEPRRGAGGKPSSAGPDEEIILKELPAQATDASPEELCGKFRGKTCKTASISAMHRSLRRMGITRKKNFLRP